jgi:hypothetical protein
MEPNTQPKVIETISLKSNNELAIIAIILHKNKYTYRVLSNKKFKNTNMYFSTIEECKRVILRIASQIT